MFIIFSWAPDTLYLQIAEFLSLANASTTSEGDKGKLVLRNASRLSTPSRVPNAIDEALGVKGLRIWVDILTKGPDVDPIASGIEHLAHVGRAGHHIAASDGVALQRA